MANIKDKNRLDYLDIGKALAIILVVLGHCIPPDNVPQWAKVIYSFHMPFFFMVCGVTAHELKEYSFKGFLKYTLKNFITLMIPYFIWCFIYMPINIENIIRIFYGSCEGIIASGVGCFQLWFLPCLFIARIFMYGVLLIDNHFKKKAIFINIPIAIISFVIGFSLPLLTNGYFWCFNISFVALGIIIIGHYYSNTLNLIDNKNNLFQIPFIIISIIALYLGNFIGTKDLAFVSMCTAEYRNIFWFFFNAIAGCILLRSTATVIAKIDLKSKLYFIKNGLSWIGKNTIGILCVHLPIITNNISKIVSNTLNQPISKLYVAIISMIIIMFISIVLTMLINKFLPILFGRSFKRRRHE